MSNGPNTFGDANPFADPSIQNVTKNVQMTEQSLDDYNPFAKENQHIKPAAIISTSNNSAVTSSATNVDQIKVQNQPQPIPTSYSQTNVNLSEMERQQAELDRRAAELERRERMLSSPTNTKNFPPLPSWCPGPLKPCFYQDISVEIPLEFQRWTRLLFYLWLFYTFTLGLNIITALAVLIATNDYGANFGFSIFYFILFVPLSYICWFRPAYKAFRSDSSVNFMLFFFVFFCQIVVNCIETIGFKDSGFCGIILLISVFSIKGVGSIVSGLFCVFSTISFLFTTGANVLILMKIHALYRNSAASFEKAQAEFATTMMSNKNVQNAAKEVFTETAKASLKQGRF